MILLPAGLIGYEHGVERGVFFFAGVLVLFTTCLFVPFLIERRKYGSNPFK